MAIRYGSFQEMYQVVRNGAKPVELEKAKKNSKGVKVRLIKAITSPKGFNLPMEMENGKIVTRYITFEPDTTYKVPDETFLKALETRGLSELQYSAEFENALKEEKVPYEIRHCRTCGGGLKKIKVQIFEVTGK